MQKFDKDELERRVDEVLFYIWDPIGVSPDPNARREYSSYVKNILRMLEDGEELTKIANYLCKIEEGMMALKPNKDKINKVVELLILNMEAIEAGRA